jgi:hypothetical protein
MGIHNIGQDEWKRAIVLSFELIINSNTSIYISSAALALGFAISHLLSVRRVPTCSLAAIHITVHSGIKLIHHL